MAVINKKSYLSKLIKRLKENGLLPTLLQCIDGEGSALDAEGGIRSLLIQGGTKLSDEDQGIHPCKLWIEPNKLLTGYLVYDISGIYGSGGSETGSGYHMNIDFIAYYSDTQEIGVYKIIDNFNYEYINETMTITDLRMMVEEVEGEVITPDDITTTIASELEAVAHISYNEAKLAIPLADAVNGLIGDGHIQAGGGSLYLHRVYQSVYMEAGNFRMSNMNLVVLSTEPQQYTDGNVSSTTQKPLMSYLSSYYNSVTISNIPFVPVSRIKIERKVDGTWTELTPWVDYFPAIGYYSSGGNSGIGIRLSDGSIQIVAYPSGSSGKLSDVVTQLF